MSRKIRSRRSQSGFIVTIELLLLATILVIGLIVGMTTVRDAVLTELADVSNSIGALNQSFTVSAVSNAAGTAATSGSAWTDSPDTNLGKPIDFAVGDAGNPLGPELQFAPANPGVGEAAAPVLQ
jgi:hypothetical protein